MDVKHHLSTLPVRGRYGRTQMVRLAVAKIMLKDMLGNHTLYIVIVLYF